MVSDAANALSPPPPQSYHIASSRPHSSVSLTISNHLIRMANQTHKHDANELKLLFNEIADICEIDRSSIAGAREHILSLLRDGMNARRFCDVNGFPATDDNDMYSRLMGGLAKFAPTDAMLGITAAGHDTETTLDRITANLRDGAARDSIGVAKKIVRSLLAIIETGPYQNRSRMMDAISNYIDAHKTVPLWTTIDAVLRESPAARYSDRASFVQKVQDLFPLVDRQWDLLEKDLENRSATEQERLNAQSILGRAVAATRYLHPTHDFDNLLVNIREVDYVRWFSDSLKNNRKST